jgi:hypothetical protein
VKKDDLFELCQYGRSIGSASLQLMRTFWIGDGDGDGEVVMLQMSEVDSRMNARDEQVDDGAVPNTCNVPSDVSV